MKKVACIIIVAIGLVSCQNQMSDDGKTVHSLGKSLIRSLFHSKKSNQSDSTQADNKQFDFSLKNEFAKKFGL